MVGFPINLLCYVSNDRTRRALEKYKGSSLANRSLPDIHSEFVP